MLRISNHFISFTPLNKITLLFPFVLLFFIFISCGGGSGGGSDDDSNDDVSYFTIETYSWENPDHVNRVITIDFDSDGDLDIVLTPEMPHTFPQTFGKVRAFKNDGQANFTDVSLHVFQNAMFSGDNDYAVADFNGDGLIDLFLPNLGNDTTPNPGGQNRIFIQNQDGQLIDETMGRLPIVDGYTHYCAIGDFDNDDDIDICVTPGFDQIEFYINNGNGYFTINTERLPVEVRLSDTINSVLFLDVDKDGALDLVLSDRLLLNDGNGNFTSSPELALPVDYNSGIEILSSDFNGDGWPDLILNKTNGTDYSILSVYYIINNQDGTFYDASSLFPQNYRNDLFKLADMNNDGYMDLLTVHPIEIQGMKIYYNTGDGGFIERTSLLPSVCQDGFISFNTGDFDGDGDIDIFAWTADWKYHVIKNSKAFDAGVIKLDPPLAPTLLSPMNEGTVGKSPDLIWEENGPTTSSHVQLATDIDFNVIVLERDRITSNHYIPNLSAIKTFYWRVRGSNTVGNSSWSESWAFTTENNAPTSIELSTNSIVEYSPLGTSVGQFNTIDPDGGDEHTYSFATGDGTNDADNDSFIIDGDSLKSNVQINHASKPTYYIYIRSDDGFGETFEQAFTIEVIQYGLVAYYPFNGNANDESDNANHGTVNGAVLTTDRLDSDDCAYSFDGNDDNISLGNNLGLVNNSDKLTIAAWIYPYEVSSDLGRQYTILGERGGDHNYQFAVMDNYLWFTFWSDSDEYNFGGHQDRIEANKWIFVAVTYDGITVRFYINGQLEASSGASGDINGYDSILFIGSFNGVDGIFNGKIDDLLVFNRALPDGEILDIYENGLPFQ